MSATDTVISMIRSTLRIAQKTSITPEQRAEAEKAEALLPEFKRILAGEPAPAPQKPAA